MKLILSDGTAVPLSADFSFDMELHNSFFSDEGSASLPVQIPATKELLSRLGNPERLASDSPYVRILDAELSAGIFRHTGKLIIASVRRDDHVEAVLAVNDGDFNTSCGELRLPDIMSASYGSAHTFDSAAELSQYLVSIYTGDTEDPDLILFPVAVNRQESDGVVSYSYLNEPAGASLTDGLQWESRIVQDGDRQTSVPDGYGLAPFLYLDRMMVMLFSSCGWTLQLTRQQTALLHSLVIVHRCADSCVRGYIDYGDLVPDITMSELIEWLRCRFHGQIRFDTSRKEARLVLMEDMLQADGDLDLTNCVHDYPQVLLDAPSRVRLSVDTSLDGASPAAATLSELVQRYGYIWYENEQDFAGSSHKDCLVCRLASGDYYEVRRNMAGGVSKVRIGSNAMPYDRCNTEEAEDYQAIDCITPMVFCGSRLMPFVGDVIHRHTNRLGQTAETPSPQPLLLCRYGELSSDGSYRYGTTQSYDDAGEPVAGALTLTPEGLYGQFWQQYNNLLLGGRVHVRAVVHHQVSDLSVFDIYRPKRYLGQHLLPVSVRAAIGQDVQPGECEYLLLQQMSEPVQDIVPTADRPALEWKKQTNYDSIIVNLAQGWDQAYGEENWSITGEVWLDDPDETVYLGIATTEGQVTHRYTRKLRIHVSWSSNSASGDFSRIVEIDHWFVAVPAAG